MAGKQVFFGYHVEAVEKFGHAALALRRGRTFVQQRRLDVFIDGQLVDEMVGLEHEADVVAVQFGALLFSKALHGFVQKKVLALGGFFQQAQNVHQRRLARAGRPHDGDKFALFDIHGDVAQNVGFTESGGVMLGDVFELNHFFWLTVDG